MAINMIDWLTHITLFIIAVIANGFSALSGGGAGLLQFPVLIFLGLPFSVALATHKIATVALGLGAAARHLRENTLERNFSTFVLACGLPGVVLGASLILNVPERPAEITLGLLTVALGLYSLLKPSLGQDHTPRNRDLRGYFIGSLLIFFVGIFNGSLSSGSGLFLTMVFVKYFGLDYKRAVAYTMALCGLIWNGTGALVLGIIGTVQYNWLPALLLGAVIGGYTGSHLAIIKGNLWIKRSFELVTILVGLKLLVG